MDERTKIELHRLQAAVTPRYVVERLLGRGRMGVVFLARDVSLERPVAIKLLPPEYASDLDARERFLREARTAARLEHPGIVPIHYVDHSDELVYYVMKYVSGETLRRRIEAAEQLHAQEVARIVVEVAGALDYAHRNGVIHRDVKADNILLEGATPRAMVTDFGVARIADHRTLTATGELLGSVHYASPEQLSGSSVDARSDLYSLGVVTYYALAGALPFDAPTIAGVIGQHLVDPPPPIAASRPDLPRELERVIERALAKDPAERFESTGEFAGALRAALNGQAVQEAGGAIRKWFRRLSRRSQPALAPPDTSVPVEQAAPVQSADDLYASLPPPVREQLAGVPIVVQLMRQQVEATRRREAELVGALTEAGGNSLDGDRAKLQTLKRDPARRRAATLLERRVSAVSDLSGACEAVRDSRASALSALESLRVGLIRLRAGVATVGEVASDVQTARVTSREIDTVLSGAPSAAPPEDTLFSQLHRL